LGFGSLAQSNAQLVFQRSMSLCPKLTRLPSYVNQKNVSVEGEQIGKKFPFSMEDFENHEV
jgi:hypothetical protein